MSHAPSPLRRVITTILTWHAAGIGLAGVCFGASTFAWTLGESGFGEMVFGTVFMGGSMLLTTLIWTPVALLILTGWVGLAALIPPLECGPAWRRTAILSALAGALTIPFLVAMWLLFGMRATGETRPAVVVILTTVSRDWWYSLMYFPAAFGWLVLPRLLIKSLRAPIVGPRGSEASHR